MAGFFPLSGLRPMHRRNRPMQMRTVAGVVELKVAYGQDPGTNTGVVRCGNFGG